MRKNKFGIIAQRLLPKITIWLKFHANIGHWAVHKVFGWLAKMRNKIQLILRSGLCVVF